jgi:phenylalanyl-tRNA synthetase beta chain
MQGNLRLFEIGAAFQPSARGSLPREETHAAVLVMGERRPPHFTEPRPPAFDEWDAKALGELLARSAFPGAEIALEPLGGDALWAIRVDGESLGVVRRVTLDAPVWASSAFGIELSLGLTDSTPVAAPGAHAHALLDATQPAATVHRRFTPLPTTPPAEFDLALLVPDALRAADVEAVIRTSAGDLLEKLELFDLYTGDGVERGRRSLAWRLTLRHAERTLRDKEIEGRRARILAALQQELDVRPRTS